jgi:peroxiredoxin
MISAAGIGGEISTSLQQGRLAWGEAGARLRQEDPMCARILAILSVLSCLAALADSPAPKVGSNAPAFSIPDQEGRNVTLREHVGKIVVLEWFDPDCDYSKRDFAAKTSKMLSEKYKAKDVIWIAINSTRDSSAEKSKTLVKQNEWGFAILPDTTGAVARLFGVTVTPYFVIVDKNGSMAYAGPPDDDDSREGEKKEGRIQYIDRALNELTGGKPVSMPEGRAYGCPLK